MTKTNLDFPASKAMIASERAEVTASGPGVIPIRNSTMKNARAAGFKFSSIDMVPGRAGSQDAFKVKSRGVSV